MRNIVVVGTFDSRADAEQAAQMLADRGIGRSDIDIHSLDREEQRTSTSGEGTSWWDWLFGESEQSSYYSENVRGGGAVLTVTADDPGQAQRVRQLMESQGAEVESQGGQTAATTGETRERVGTAHQAGGGDREEVLPVAEEQLKVGKRPVVKGGVRIFRRMSEKPAEEQVRLREEHVNVERRPVDRPVREGAGADAFRDEVIEITEMAEEPVIAKEVRVVEEVVVNKEVVEHDQTVRDRVRRSDVEIERADEDDFRRHWAQSGRSGGQGYEEYDPAYRFGRELSASGSDGEWSTIEADARRRWEERNPGTWERFKDAIRYAWEGGRGGRRRAA